MTENQNTDIKPTSNALLLLEIGTEEIPARFLPDAMAKLKENAEKIFIEYRLSSNEIKTFATPRRLSMITEVARLQEASEKEVWGPPVTAAFDKEGNPTKAAEAFANMHSLKIEDLLKKEKGKGTYLAALVKESAQETTGLLPEILSKLILSLSFPKSMRWGSSDLRFARPIHWILSTYDNKKVALSIDSIKSSNMTRGHRFLSPAAFEIKDCRTYLNLLRNNFVILDADERKKIILDGAKKLAASVNTSLIEDNELLQHVTCLLEYPVPVLGTFSPDYLSLPKELLITVMKGHQKYFALEDNEGKLANHFIVVSNTKYDNADTIKKGAEKVIKARFEDARFYFEEDKKIPLKERLEELKKVIYHDRLGSLYDKSLRIASIADFLADTCSTAKKDAIHTAALLTKTDLISGAVREFPELQGIMGSYYAQHDGYNEETARSLSEQYLPAYSGDRLPATDIGAILSLSDKLDNMASFFMLELSPTGSEDPFALRRQALGIISMLMDRQYGFSISELLNRALQPFNIENKEDILDNLIKFFELRLESIFMSSSYPSDSISAVMDFAKDSPLHILKERIDAIQKIKEDSDYEAFLLAIKRVNNIAPKNEVPPVDKTLFAQDEESMLYRKVENISPHAHSLLKENNFYDAIKLLMTLKEPINRFFDKVLIMDKNEEIKQNRLALIKTIQTLARQIANFSRLA